MTSALQLTPQSLNKAMLVPWHANAAEALYLHTMLR